MHKGVCICVRGDLGNRPMGGLMGEGWAGLVIECRTVIGHWTQTMGGLKRIWRLCAPPPLLLSCSASGKCMAERSWMHPLGWPCTSGRLACLLVWHFLLPPPRTESGGTWTTYGQTNTHWLSFVCHCNRYISLEERWRQLNKTRSVF